MSRLAESLRSIDRRAVVAWVLVVPWGLWSVVRLFGLEAGYPSVPLMAYTPYVALSAVMPLGVALALRRFAAAAVAALTLVYLAAAVLPRAFSNGGATKPNSGPTLRVLAANLRRGHASTSDLLATIRERRADLVSLEELTPIKARELQRAHLDAFLPQSVLAVEAGAFGCGLYSRYPLHRIKSELAKFPRANLVIPGYGSVQVQCVHTVAPRSSSSVAKWEHDFAALPPALPNGPVRILAGDFNATLDHSELRDLIDTGYRDAADARGAGLIPTWSAGQILPPPVTIDHVLADKRVAITDYGVDDLVGTDHRSIYAALSLP
jgi:endonuclease/exonuclease/phosphatase (EEP) superfamily protein YafD